MLFGQSGGRPDRGSREARARKADSMNFPDAPLGTFPKSHCGIGCGATHASADGGRKQQKSGTRYAGRLPAPGPTPAPGWRPNRQPVQNAAAPRRTRIVSDGVRWRNGRMRDAH